MTRITRCFFFFIGLLAGATVFAQNTSSSNSPSFKMSGQAQLHSNYVERGITQTQKDPALLGTFAFGFGPQFSLGLTGSNVSYPDTPDTHFWLRVFAAVKLNFSENFIGELRFQQHNFYKTNTRNGNTISLDFEIFKYKVIYAMDSNWEGTQTGDSYFAFGKTYDVFGNWKWENLIGYNMVKADGFSNYFNVETFLGKQTSSFYFQGGITDTTSSSQFGGRGDLAFIFKATMGF